MAITRAMVRTKIQAMSTKDGEGGDCDGKGSGKDGDADYRGNAMSNECHCVGNDDTSTINNGAAVLGERGITIGKQIFP